jgi:hypothetical protein
MALLRALVDESGVFLCIDIIPSWLSILVYHLGDEQQARWWPQFRDVLTPSK